MKYLFWFSGLVLATALIVFVFIPAFAGNLLIPTQINLGNFGIRLYGITMAFSILLGYWIARKNSWRFGVSKEGVDDMTFWLTLVALVGARIYYVIFEWSFYSGNFSEIYKIWHGGLSIYGAIISGLIFILFYAKRKAYSNFQLMDLAAISLPLGQALGRLGNFFNQEAFGLPTNLPWKMYIDPANRPIELRQYNYFHPTFLYEAVVNIFIYFILTKLLLGKVKPGVLAFSYLGLYCVGRFFIEGLRLDSAFIHGVKVDQITSVAGVLFAGIMLIFVHKKLANKLQG